jgi:hypothetical protein
MSDWFEYAYCIYAYCIAPIHTQRTHVRIGRQLVLGGGVTRLREK